ncbi:hypothetical protein LINPERHAP1_LOCUS9194 [Linum perenne]
MKNSQLSVTYVGVSDT